MSNITIQPNGSGTGTFSIASPNSNTNRTLTLPDTTGVLLNDASSLASGKLTGALPAIDGSALTGIGASTTFDAVGTYCLGFYTGLGIHNGGATFAGSGIRTANTYAGGGGTSGSSASTLSGTWRLMGNIGYYNGGSSTSNANVSSTLFVRIS